MRVIVLLLAIFTSAVGAETLLTDTYSIQIQRECEEGNVTCDKIRFTYTVAGSDAPRVAMGSTVHSTCADGITPCAFRGYAFSSESHQFFILSSGTLEVMDYEGNLLLTEPGAWQ